MTTHDKIELPPLPPGYKSYEFPDGGYDEDEMRTYAIAAIEADRKRTADLLKNPIHVHVNMCRGIIAPITFDQLAHVLGDEATEAWLADRQRRGEPANESQRVYLHDEGRPEYLDGAQCQYVIERGKPYPLGDTVAFVYEKKDAERIVAALNEPCRGEPVAWPKTAAEIRDFIDVHYISMAGDDDPSDDDKYTLTAHDLLSAFRWWTGFAPQAAEPVAPNGWKLVPETPTSKQIVHMACQIKGADEDGWFRTEGDDWPEYVDAAERAYKWALSEAPQPANPVVKESLTVAEPDTCPLFAAVEAGNSEPVKMPSEAKEALWKAYESLRELEKRIVLDANQISGAAAASFAANRVLALLARYATTQEQP